MARGRKRRGGARSGAALLPLGIWTALMVLFPMGYVFVLSFLQRGESYGVIWQFTWENYRALADSANLEILGNSLKIGLYTTVLTLLFGYPFAYAMASRPKKRRALLMLLVIIPFWTSALLRVYGWMILLRTRGMVNDALLWLGVIEKRIKFLNNMGAVLFGMTYSLLPFMILPIYASLEKLDPSVREAARDLGAGPIASFRTVVLPLTVPGIISGCVLVFVPAVGMFFISDLLGGGSNMLLGNLISYYFGAGKNWPMAASLSMIMVVLTFFTVAIYRRVSDGEMGVF